MVHVHVDGIESSWNEMKEAFPSLKMSIESTTCKNGMFSRRAPQPRALSLSLLWLFHRLYRTLRCSPAAWCPVLGTGDWGLRTWANYHLWTGLPIQTTSPTLPRKNLFQWPPAPAPAPALSLLTILAHWLHWLHGAPRGWLWNMGCFWGNGRGRTPV